MSDALLNLGNSVDSRVPGNRLEMILKMRAKCRFSLNSQWAKSTKTKEIRYNCIFMEFIVK
jgi:hypothetical protein